LEGADESGSYSAWLMEGSLMTSYEMQYDDRRIMDEIEKEEAWFIDG